MQSIDANVEFQSETAPPPAALCDAGAVGVKVTVSTGIGTSVRPSV
jgi:hypothetical protein